MTSEKHIRLHCIPARPVERFFIALARAQAGGFKKIVMLFRRTSG
jgi:hypothetical protein